MGAIIRHCGNRISPLVNHWPARSKRSRKRCFANRAIINYAIANNYIIFTNDLDFGSILATTQAVLPSVIQVRNQDLLPSAIGDLVISALRQFQNQLESGALITVDNYRSRVRILPII